MKKNNQKKLLTAGLFSLLLICIVSCTTVSIPKSEAYKGFYEEKPVTVLVMPPINNSTNVDAKDYFYSTLSVPVCNSGYYVFPAFLAMETLQHESAYDSERFLDSDVSKFNKLFGADLLMFTVIKSWEKDAVFTSQITITVQYIFKSAKTNEVVYKREGKIICDTSVKTGLSNSGGVLGLIGLIADKTLSVINTAVTDYVAVARDCNNYVLNSDLPKGKYSSTYGQDGEEIAGPTNFTVSISK
jgi:hypothetical protein